MIYVCITAYGAETETNSISDVLLVTKLSAVDTYIDTQYRKNKQSFFPTKKAKIAFESGMYVQRFDSREEDGKMMFVIVKAIEREVRHADSVILCYHSYPAEFLVNFRCPFDIAVCSRKTSALEWLTDEIAEAETRDFYAVDNFGNFTVYPSEELLSYIPYCDVVLRSVRDGLEFTLSVREVKVRFSRQRQRKMQYKGTFDGKWSELPLSDHPEDNNLTRTA